MLLFTIHILKLYNYNFKRNHRYLHDLTELEVNSAVEFAEILVRGLKRRRVAHTILNVESSRSHAVFNIRVVQAPFNKLVSFFKGMFVIELLIYLV